jgi:hypothetical protein
MYLKIQAQQTATHLRYGDAFGFRWRWVALVAAAAE